MRNISESIADWLVQNGIEQVFTVTGGGAMFLNQALGAHERLRCTFMHHEQACAMAAEGYARISGKPAVVMLTTGPGAINALNGVYGAYMDSIPMIVLSGQIKRATCLSFNDVPGLRQLGDQEGPTIKMAGPVCKYSREILDEEDLIQALPEAYRQAVSGRPGPVWLDIPLDIQQSKAQIEIQSSALGMADSIDSAQREEVRLSCRRVIAKLLESHRPLILGGTGVRIARCQARVIKLIERIRVPLATAWTHDLIESDHPLFAGRPGTIGTRAGNFAVQAADFVLVLGSRLNIRQVSYNWDSFAKNAWVAQVDVDVAELSKPTFRPDLGIAADLNLFLDLLEDELDDALIPDFSPWIDWCQMLRQRYSILAEHHQEPGKALNPYIVIDRIFEKLRDDDIVVCSNASACIIPFQAGMLQRGQRMYSNSGSASMGYGLPSALGAAVAARKDRRRVVCFEGDGSLQMNIQEFQTLKTTQENVIVIIINNSGYLSIWQTHENFFGRIVGATPASGVEFPNFVDVSRAYGIRSSSIRTEQDLERLDQLLKEDGPMIIDLHVDSHQGFSPRIKSRVNEQGQFMTPELDDMYPFLPHETLEEVRGQGCAIRALPGKGRVCDAAN